MRLAAGANIDADYIDADPDESSVGGANRRTDARSDKATDTTPASRSDAPPEFVADQSDDCAHCIADN